MRGRARDGLHPQTAQALAQVREQRGKAIVLLNRRGWSNFLSCRSCGRVWSCPECDVALVLHRAEGYVACHHCGHREPAPERCEQCGSISVARHGAGTERVAARARDRARRRRGDDVSRSSAWTPTSRRRASGRVATLLRRFEAAASRGADRHADGRQGPRLPRRDPRRRARRRRDPALPRLPRRGAHVRADRPARRPGRARRRAGACSCRRIAPEARAIAHAAHHDSDGFLAGELERREALRYPPFSHLIRIVCSAVEARAGARGRRRAARAAATRSPLGLQVGNCASWGRRRCSACVAGSARCSSSRPPSVALRCAPSARRCGVWRPQDRTHEASASASTSTRNKLARHGLTTTRIWRVAR